MNTVKPYDVLHKRVLVTRESARQLASVLADAMESGRGDITLDFSSVEGITPSFVDEILAVLQELGQNEQGPVRVGFLNPPTRLSTKFAAVGTGRRVSIAEPEEGLWTIEIRPKHPNKA